VNRKSKDTSQRLSLFQSGATVLCSYLRADQVKIFRPQRFPGANGRVRARSRLRTFGKIGTVECFALRIDLAASFQSFSDGPLFIVGSVPNFRGRGPFCDFRHPVSLTQPHPAYPWSIFIGNALSRRGRVANVQTLVFSRHTHAGPQHRKVRERRRWQSEPQSTIRENLI
jgi:hypothetical protein